MPEIPENKIEEGLTNGMEESEPQHHFEAQDEKKENVNDPAPEEPRGQDDWYATEGSRAVN